MSESNLTLLRSLNQIRRRRAASVAIAVDDFDVHMHTGLYGHILG